MARVSVRMDSPPVAYVKIMGPGSEVDRNMKGRARDVRNRAILLAPVGNTGRLKQSISASQSRDERGRFSFGYEVVADAPYAVFVHEGTAPRVRETFPRTMKFDGTNNHKGQTVYTDIVHHPGNRAQPFLAQALTAAV